MAKLHIANFVEVRHWIVPDDDERDNGSWQTQNRFQNANIFNTINHDGHDWGFLSFIYNGATRSKSGDNIESSILVSTNQISMDYAYDIVTVDFNQNQHHIKRQVMVQTCLLNDDFTAVKKVLSIEYWIGASMGYNAEVVEIALSSGVDAVFAGLPNMVLDENNVGRLPTTSRIATS